MNEEEILEKIRRYIVYNIAYVGKEYSFNSSVMNAIEELKLYDVNYSDIVQKLKNSYLYKEKFFYSGLPIIKKLVKTSYEEFINYMTPTRYFKETEIEIENGKNLKVRKRGYIWFVETIDDIGYGLVNSFKNESKMKVIKYYTLSRDFVNYTNPEITEEEKPLLKKMKLTGGGGYWVVWRYIRIDEKQNFDEYLKEKIRKGEVKK